MPSPRPFPRGEGENTKDFPDRKVLLFILRDFFFHRPVKEKKIWPLRLKVAEKKHGGE